MADGIHAITMPKWGLAMTEGKLGDWIVDEGDEIESGDELLEVETEKITGAVEAAVNGTLRRCVGEAGETLTVGALLGVVASHASGGLSAVLAPTEILAAQRHATFSRLAKPLGLRVALLTGSSSVAQRRSLQRLLQLGEIAVVVGPIDPHTKRSLPGSSNRARRRRSANIWRSRKTRTIGRRMNPRSCCGKTGARPARR